jgi:TRAP-type C4-dicarboxylate transport system substrate-binding protein
MRIYEQTKFATVGGDYTLWWLLQPLVMSKASWDKLTPEQKKIFQEAADKSDQWFKTAQAEAVTNMENVYRKAGAQVKPLTKAEFEAWIELAKKTAWPEFAAKSADAKQLLDLLSRTK